MPWHIPEDLRHFKEATMGHPVIMGRVTYEGILETLGEPLPGRTTVVLTSRDLETPEGAVVAHGLESAIDRAETAARERHDADRIFVAGGATVYRQFLPAVDRLGRNRSPRRPGRRYVVSGVGPSRVENRLPRRAGRVRLPRVRPSRVSDTAPRNQFATGF